MVDFKNFHEGGFMSYEERRKFPRANYPCRIILFSGEEREVLSLHTENISAGGIRIILDKKMDINSSVDIEMFLEVKPIKCKGRVVWMTDIRPVKGEKSFIFDVGIEFTEITEEDKDKIQQLVEMLIK